MVVSGKENGVKGPASYMRVSVSTEVLWKSMVQRGMAHQAQAEVPGNQH